MIQTIGIPLAYSPKESWLVRLREDPNIDKQVAITLPRMGFELTNFIYAPERQLPSTLRNVKITTPGGSTVNAQYVPVPYDISFSLYIFAQHTDDGIQILEQILPYFRPEFTTNINIIPSMDISVDIPIVLAGVSPEEVYEGDFETRQAIIYSLDFTMKGYFYGPVVTKGVITRAIVDIHNSLANNAPVAERITVTPSGTVIDMEGFGFSSAAATSRPDGADSSVVSTKLLRLFDNDSSDFLSFQTPHTLSQSTVFTLPDGDGTSKQFLSTDGAGTLTWTDDIEIYNYTWTVAGNITATTLPPMFILTDSANEEVQLVKFRSMIQSGTNVEVKFQKNGVDIPTASVITTKTADTTTLATANTVVDTDELGIVLSSPTGSPTDLSVTAYITRKRV